MEAMLTPRQVAARLGVSPRTVYLWVEQGRLPHARFSERVLRVPAAAVDAFVAGSMRPAATGPLAAEARASYGSPMAIAPHALPVAEDAASERLRALMREHRDEMIAIADGCRAQNLRVFGSVARGDATADSDVDLLVDLRPHASLFDIGELECELTRLLGVKVDVVPARSVKASIRERVLREAVPL